jgi:hypothetical protein
MQQPSPAWWSVLAIYAAILIVGFGAALLIASP